MRAWIGLVSLGLATPALARVENPQPGPPPTRPAPATPPGWSVTIGAAPIISPAWQGSRDMALSIFPDLRVNYGDTLFVSIPGGLGWNAINRNGWKAGPLAKIRFGRDEERGGSPFLVTGGSDALAGLGNVSAAAELGGFVEKRAGPLRGRIEARRGFGGHEGVVADLSLGYQQRVGRTVANLGPRLTLGSAAYLDPYFGIDAAQSARSRLRRYDPDGGLVSFGLGGSVLRPVDRRSALTLFTGLDRLAGDAADSPLIRERGRRMQFTLGVGYGFRFGL